MNDESVKCRWLVMSTWYVLYGLLLVLIIEWAMPRWIMPFLPPFVASLFDEPDGAWLLMQTSKRSGIAKEPYWVILGDSYAKGMGDGQIDQLTNFYAADYTAGHALYKRWNRDVVSFAEPGSGSWRGLFSNYLEGLNYLKRAGIDWPSTPEIMIYFFYEGNDLAENQIYASKVFTGLSPNSSLETFAARAIDRSKIKSADGSTWFLPQMLSNALAIATGKSKSLDEAAKQSDTYVPIRRWLPRMQGRSLNSAWFGERQVMLPGNLQGPALELSAAELVQSVWHFDRALSINRRQWSDVPLVIVYIPSVLGCYQLAGDRIEAQNLLADETLKVGIAELHQRHREIKSAIAQSAQQQGTQFLDATAVLQQACASRPLHGPKDWNHLNADGYRVLGEWLAEQLTEVMPLIRPNFSKNN